MTADPPRKDGLAAVRLVMNNAEPVPAPRASMDPHAGAGVAASRQAGSPHARDGAAEPPFDDRQDDGGGPPPDEALPDGCPVTALGHDRNLYFFLNAARQFCELKAKEVVRLEIESLFGTHAQLLEQYWPRYSKPNKEGLSYVIGVKYEQAARALMTDCARAGIWKKEERLRGRGAWLGDAGELVLHCGDVIVSGAELAMPGLIGRYVYPGAPAALRPALKGSGDGRRAAMELLETLKTWNWKRGVLDAELALGWICAAMIGGALHWRPLMWITGASGTGKSHFDKLVPLVFGGNVIAVTNASAAGIWQQMASETIPVIFDELESAADNRKQLAIIEYARQAASGGRILRGSSEHQAREFTARSCFMFSSINIPPLKQQDRNRMLVLELNPLRNDKPPALDRVRWGRAGALILRRLADNWEAYPETLETFTYALGQVGFSARRQAVLGNILTCLDLVMGGAKPDPDLAAAWADKLAKAMIGDAEYEIDDQEHLLAHLLTTVIPLDGSAAAKRTVAQWIAFARDEEEGRRRPLIPEDEDEATTLETNQVLGNHGLRVVKINDEYMVAIANGHQGLSRIFRDTHWADAPGALGAWITVLRRLPGHVVPKKPIRIGGVSGRCTLIPLRIALPAPETSARDQRADNF